MACRLVLYCCNEGTLSTQIISQHILIKMENRPAVQECGIERIRLNNEKRE